MSLSGVVRDLSEVAVIDSKHFSEMFWLIGILVAVGMAAILIHRLGQRRAASRADDTSMTRPVLAILLVGGVLILAVMSFELADEETRNLLVGAVISLASAAAAFYFASTTATEARRDLLSATVGSTAVPLLTGKTLVEAREVMSATHLRLTVQDDPARDASPVTSQEPAGGTSVKVGTTVEISFK
jgi:peptidoglycan/LPS O-acetylase OafA/YrhL